MDKLISLYNFQAHPRVRTREKRPETVQSDFMNCIGARSKNGFISEFDFIEYYADVNACL